MTTRVAAPVAETFPFFSKAENLGLLTPASMRFSLAGPPPEIAENTPIDYRLRVGGVPIAWRSRIVNWEPGARFVDFQEKGPYRAWWHEHSLRAEGTSTVMQDRVCYAPPFGLLGRLANAIVIVPTLTRIFRYRADVIRLRFGGD
jgi:ligand-binding SRPBCC domain-containing protein